MKPALNWTAEAKNNTEIMNNDSQMVGAHLHQFCLISNFVWEPSPIFDENNWFSGHTGFRTFLAVFVLRKSFSKTSCTSSKLQPKYNSEVR